MAETRKCGGTPPRPAYGYVEEDIDRKLNYFHKKIAVPADVAHAGCGTPVVIKPVRKTKAEKGNRPLFAKTLDLVTCPKCDGPSA